MPALILDTSTSLAVLALITEEGGLLASHVYPHENHLSATLLSSVNSFLEQHNLELKDLHYIAVGNGPGSYTGTRVGASVAASWAFALCIPLVPFCSLLAFLPIQEGPFISLRAAKGGSHFFITGSLANGKLTEVEAGYFKEGAPSPVVQVVHDSSCFTPHLLAHWIHEHYTSGAHVPPEKLELTYFH